MNSLDIGMKIMDLVSRPVNMFFGSDERGFMTLFFAMLVTFAAGYPDAATIIAVYDAVFAFSGMQAYNSQGSSNGQELDDIEDMMDDALGMAQEFQKEGEKE